MKLVLLGTAGYHPSTQRQTACLMLPELGVVLDAGTGFFRARDWLQTDTLDIFVTHAHLDHCVGLTYLIDVLSGRSMQRTTIHAAADKLEAIRTHLFSELLFPVLPAAEFRELSGPVKLPLGGTLTSFPLKHPGGVLGFRLDWPDRSLAYVTDTTADANADYVERIRGVDLLVHECNFDDDMADWAETTGHSTLTPVVQVAAKAGVGRLVLVHVNPLAPQDEPLDLKHARQVFRHTDIGCDGQEILF